MSMRIARIIAVSGAATAALLGTASTIPAAAAETPSSVVLAADYQTQPGHADTVMQFAQDTDPSDSNGEDAEGGAGTTFPNPYEQQNEGEQIPNGPGTQQVGEPTQIQTQSGGGTIAVGTFATAVLLVVGFFVLKRGAKTGHAVLFVCIGVMLGGTFIGPLVMQLSSTGATAFSNVLNGL
ncbi:hypothetical protein ACXZ65_34330 [Streptomyces aculeolatus]